MIDNHPEQLDLFARRPKAPGVDELVAFLRGKGWMTRRQISAVTGWDERLVRAIASESDDIVSYPGSPGYKLLVECTRDEYESYRNARKSQARDMIAKVVRTDRIYFRRSAMPL